MNCDVTFASTTENIKNIRKFFSEDELLKTDKKNKYTEILYKYIKKHINKKKEYGVLLNMKLEPKEYFFGSKGMIPIENKRYGGTLVHNHPKPSLLSDSDVVCVVNKTFNAVACCVKINDKIYLELFKRKKNSNTIPYLDLYDAFLRSKRSTYVGLYEFMSQDRSVLDCLAKRYNYIHKLWRVK
jgi:hypothetical protein